MTCTELVATTVTPGTVPVIEQCGWLHRCPECERRYAIVRAHLAAARNRSRTYGLIDLYL